MTDPTKAEPAPVADPAEPEGGGSMGDSGDHGDADPAEAEAHNYRRALAGGSAINEPEPEGE